MENPYLKELSFVSQQKKGRLPNRKKISPSKNTFLGIFRIALSLRDRHIFMWVAGDFNRFRYFNFKSNFSEKKKIFFKKPNYHFLVEGTTIENTFPYKIALPNVNVKTSRMGSTKYLTQRTEFCH